VQASEPRERRQRGESVVAIDTFVLRPTAASASASEAVEAPALRNALPDDETIEAVFAIFGPPAVMSFRVEEAVEGVWPY
jgi:hypothetical protein